jgi:GAF domain/Sel1 repeat
MAAAPSSGTNQRLSLDHPSFEKLLAAAWVLQCLHDQLHNPHTGKDDRFAEPVHPPKRRELVSPAPQQVAKPADPPPRRVMEVDSKPVAVSVSPLADESLDELVEAQQAIETGILNLDAAMQRVVALSLRLTRAEGAAIWLFARDEFTYRAGAGTAFDNEKLRLAVLSSLAGAWPGNGKPAQSDPPGSKQSWVVDPSTGVASLLVAPIYLGREVAGALAAFTKRSDCFSAHTATTVRLLSGLLSHALRKAAEVEIKRVESVTVTPKQVEFHQNAPAQNVVEAPLIKPASSLSQKPRERTPLVLQESAYKLRKTFNRFLNDVNHYRATFHVNLRLRALRAVAIATPVWLLAVIAALLLLDTWRYESFHGAQVMSTPNPSTAEASVISTPPRSAISATAASEDTKKIRNIEPQSPPPSASVVVSHERVTDPSTSSIVQQLSRYEINGLRRRAKYGDDSAAFTLGMAYEIGRHVHQNCAEAARWVKTAAEEGNTAAQYNLGLRYRDGDGVAADRTESAKWLRTAAAHKNREAKLALQMLASG